jgi:curved DNA-binding protein CbpA
MMDYYRILEIPEGADLAEIKRAYRRLAMLLHPDQSRYPDSERFRRLQEAYDVLSDPQRREAYDRNRKASVAVAVNRRSPILEVRSRPVGIVREVARQSRSDQGAVRVRVHCRFRGPYSI